MKQFKSVKRIKEATLNDLEKANREASVDRTVTILQGAAVVGFVVGRRLQFFAIANRPERDLRTRTASLSQMD